MGGAREKSPGIGVDAEQKSQDKRTATEAVSHAKWAIERLKKSPKAALVAELLGIAGDNAEIQATALASELGLI